MKKSKYYALWTFNKKKVKKQNLDLNSQKILITSPYKIIQLLVKKI